MKHKVSELEGALLDVAAAKAEEELYLDGGPSYCQDWEKGGPIIEREGITLISPDRLGPPHTEWRAETMAVLMPPPYASGQFGPTPLIAAMRAYVSSKFGEEVEL